MVGQRPFGELITFDQALSTIMKEVDEVKETENVPLTVSRGRVLGENVKSSIFVPPFDRAAMDGFAVKAENTYGAGKFDPIEMRCIENVHAGETPDKKLKKGQCAQIATGAPIPEGANAVVKVEVTEKEGDTVIIYEPVHPQENISPKGEDIKEGDTVLERGKYLTPARIGALAAIGKKEVDVYKKPQIGIIPTGDEVVPLENELKPGQIYDVNSYTLSTIVEQNGGVPVRGTVVQDTLKGLKDEVNKRSKDLDMVLFSGGSSVGDRDILIDALDSLGKVIFHGVKIKPGKPTLFGKVNGTPVIGMPGYPTSCLNTAQHLIRPAIRKMASLPEPCEKTIQAALQKRITSSLGREQYMTVRLEDDKAFPVYKQSGAITSMAHADGYFKIPENVELIDRGNQIEVFLF
ncbi:MAG: gephyrin-like molybdotransferase Glp [Thermoplasmatota archaeon]